MTFLDWLANDGLRLLGDIIIPAAAILVPTLIAVRLARRERIEAATSAVQQREDASAAELRARRLDAGGEVVRAMAVFVNVDPLQMDMRADLANVRGRIAVYKAWTRSGDVSGDWLGLKYNEGMALFRSALEESGRRGPDVVHQDPDVFFEVFGPAQRWAHETVERFAAWLGGRVSDEELALDGARLMRAQGLFGDGQ